MLWQKKSTRLDPTVHAFTVGEDFLLDQKLTKYDVLGSLAHARQLLKINILKDFEFEKIKKFLHEIYQMSERGAFPIRLEDEDVHTAIENYLTLKGGDLGKKIHTGRSRNDQVLTALKLFSKAALSQIELAVLELAARCTDFARVYENTPLPGYTHTRPAMPSSVGQWAGAYAENLLEDLILIRAAYEYADASPLGSAAAYGVALPLDRAYTAELLGFAKVQNNTLACANSRGKLEGVIVAALANLFLTLGKCSADLVLFSSPEFGYFLLPEDTTTGSSIMPQKKNPDPLELIRAHSGLALGALGQIQMIVKGLTSGYHRDFQLAKKPLLETVQNTQASLAVLQKIVQGLDVKTERCQQAFTPEIFAADVANELVLKEGVPFREAYQKIGECLGTLKSIDPVQNILAKKHLGATGNLSLKKLSDEIADMKSVARERQENLERVWERLWK